MQFVCSRGTLTAALQIVAGVVPSRTTRDILKNIKLMVGGGRAILAGTDGEISIRHEIPEVATDSHGEALLPTARVLNILREMTDDEVKVEVTGDTVWIRGGYSEFRLSAEDAADFPPIPEFDESDYHVVAAPALRTLIRRTIFATDVESTRYALGGVLAEFESDKVTLAATDSRRLAVATAPASNIGSPVREGAHPVIPSKAMNLIERSLGDQTTEAHVAIRTNDMVIRCGSSVISSQLVQGRFPDFRKVIPSQTNIHIELSPAPFYAAIRQAQIVTNEESRGVTFTFENGTLRLSSQAADVGASKIELPISYDGAPLSIKFDPRFIADFLKALDPATPMTLNLIDDESAAVLSAGEDYTYVIMPLANDG